MKWQTQTENNGENYDRINNKWSQQQSALVSRIQVQLRHKKSEGSLFLCIMLSELRGRITCEQLWTDVNSMFVFYWTRFTSVNGKREHKTTTEWTTSDQWSQQQSALVSRIQVQLRHKKSEGSLFLCIMLSELRGRITCERLCTDVNSHFLHKDHKCKRHLQTENNGGNYERINSKWSQ